MTEFKLQVASRNENDRVVVLYKVTHTTMDNSVEFTIKLQDTVNGYKASIEFDNETDTTPELAFRRLEKRLGLAHNALIETVFRATVPTGNV